jgi:hypothetical protein
MQQQDQILWDVTIDYLFFLALHQLFLELQRLDLQKLFQSVFA